MKKSKTLVTFFVFVIFALLVCFFAYIKIHEAVIADASDGLRPTYEMNDLYISQQNNIPKQNLQFYESAKYLSFKSENIESKDYSIDFGDIPENHLLGLPGEYRYFIDRGSVYDTLNDTNRVGYFNALMIKVETSHLLNHKIKIDFKKNRDDVLCSYIKTVYLTVGGKKIVNYAPLSAIDNSYSATINSREKNGFLKAIYILSVTKDDTDLQFSFQGANTQMNIM